MPELDLNALLLPAAGAIGAACAALFGAWRDRRKRAAADSNAEFHGALTEQQALEVADSNYVKLLLRVGELTDLWQASERKLIAYQADMETRISSLEVQHKRELAECREENKRLRADLTKLKEQQRLAGKALLADEGS
jgi:hypothetical protein